MEMINISGFRSLAKLEAGGLSATGVRTNVKQKWKKLK